MRRIELSRLLRSTGFRLGARYAILFGVSMVVLFGVVRWTIERELRADLDRRVLLDTRFLQAQFHAYGLEGVVRAVSARAADPGQSELVSVVTARNGARLAGRLAPETGALGWHWIDIAPPGGDGRAGRMRAYVSPLGDSGLLTVGIAEAATREFEDGVSRAFLIAAVATAVLAVVGGALTSRAFLRRIDAINATAAAIMAGKLGDRMPLGGSDDEIDRLSANLNAMLDRIEDLMATVRQVSDDIAHDLRTPLGRLRQRLDAARRGARAIVDYEAAMDAAIADADEVLAAFSALLRIAAIEDVARKAAFAAVDLGDVLNQIAETYEAVAEDCGRMLICRASPAPPVQGDRALLIQMLVNLVENALRHTPEGARVEVALDQADGRARLTIADDGPGIPAAAREAVFRRFHRLERSRTSAGSGLGLSLVAAVARLHGIAVALQDNAPGLRVVLTFPASAPAHR